MNDLTAPRRGYFVRIGNEVRGLVPSWYVPHSDESVELAETDGTPILSLAGRRVKVSEVPIERRWAIREDGRLLDRMEFSDRFKRHYLEFYATIKLEDPSAQVNAGNPNFEPIPDVRAYVMVQPDPRAPLHMMEMHFDPFRKRGDGPRKLHDANGDALPHDRMEMLKEAYDSPTLRRRLKASEIAEVEATYGKAPALVVDNTAEVKALKAQLEMLATQLATVNQKKPKKKSVMACGREVDPRGVRWHVAKCEACQCAPDGGEAA